MESDHHPLLVTVKRGRKERRKKEQRERTGSGKWSQRMKEEYEKGIEGVRVEEAGLQEMIGQTEKQIKVATKRSEEEGGGQMQRKEGWWDEECKEKKEEVRRELRRWRRNM